MGLDQPRNGAEYVLTTTDKIANWGRQGSMWPMTFGLACCAVECVVLSRWAQCCHRPATVSFSGAALPELC